MRSPEPNLERSRDKTRSVQGHFHRSATMPRVGFSVVVTLLALSLIGASTASFKTPPGVSNVAQLFWRLAFGEGAMPKAGTGIECAACTVGTS
jgi:hypothetical protein